MKKFSILFATLAVVLAVGSAFTTKVFHNPVTKYEVFGMNNDAVARLSTNTTNILNNKIADGFNKIITSGTMSSFNTEVSNYNSGKSFPTPIVRCSTDTDQLCGAILTYTDNYVNPATVDVTVGGDYSLVP